MKRVQTNSSGAATVKTYWDASTREYRNRLYLSGKLQPEADYFTTGYEDAVATARAMLRQATGTAVTWVCSTCGSEDVRKDAWAEWDVDAQQWTLASVHCQAYCNACDGECTLIQRKAETQGNAAAQ